MAATKKRSFTVKENAKWMHYRINDILYGYLKVNATYYENPNDPNKDHYLYITKQKERKIRKEVAEKMKCSERTIQRQIKILIEEGLLKEFSFISNDGKKHPSYGIVQDAPPFVLLSNEWLRYLINVKNIGVIKIYVYLLQKYSIAQYYNKTTCFFTNQELLEALHYNTLYVDGQRKVKDILNDLLRCGIIDFKEITVQTEHGLRQRKQILFIAQSEKEIEQYSHRVKNN